MIIKVINLKRNVHRMTNINSVLREFGVQYERFDAVDGKLQFSVDDCDKKNNKRKERFPNSDYLLSSGDIGCACSHLELYKWLIGSTEQNMLILEDDVEIDASFGEFLNTFKFYHFDFDIIFLGYFANELRDPKCRVSSIQSIKQRHRISKEFTIGKPVHRIWTTMGYVVSRGGADKLIKANLDLTMCADELTSDYFNFGLNLFTLNPPIVFPSPLGFETETKSNHKEPNIANSSMIEILWRKIYNSKIRIKLMLLIKSFLS